MPQLNKGGKYVFGLSIISSDNKIQLPLELLLQYPANQEERIIIFTVK